MTTNTTHGINAPIVQTQDSQDKSSIKSSELSKGKEKQGGKSSSLFSNRLGKKKNSDSKEGSDKTDYAKNSNLADSKNNDQGIKNNIDNNKSNSSSNDASKSGAQGDGSFTGLVRDASNGLINLTKSLIFAIPTIAGNTFQGASNALIKTKNIIDGLINAGQEVITSAVYILWNEPRRIIPYSLLFNEASGPKYNVTTQQPIGYKGAKEIFNKYGLWHTGNIKANLTKIYANLQTLLNSSEYQNDQDVVGFLKLLSNNISEISLAPDDDDVKHQNVSINVYNAFGLLGDEISISDFSLKLEDGFDHDHTIETWLLHPEQRCQFDFSNHVENFVNSIVEYITSHPESVTMSNDNTKSYQGYKFKDTLPSDLVERLFLSIDQEAKTQDRTQSYSTYISSHLKPACLAKKSLIISLCNKYLDRCSKLGSQKVMNTKLKTIIKAIVISVFNNSYPDEFSARLEYVNQYNKFLEELTKAKSK